MYLQPPKLIYSYCGQPWPQIEKVLSDLVDARVAMLGIGLPVMEKIYRQLDLIARRLQDHKEADALTQYIDKQIVSLLELGAARNFLNNPRDKENRDIFSLQLYFINAALASLDLTPYSAEELSMVLTGEFKHYDDVVLLYTLRRAINEEKTEAFAAAIWPMFAVQKAAEAAYEWEEALLLTLILDVVWLGFPTLTIDEQKFLLQNYFYLSFVCAVPIRENLKRIFTWPLAKAQEKRENYLFKGLLDNKELVPININTGEARSLSDLINNFTASFSGDELSGFTQNKFVEDIYKSQTGRDVFGSWLRETINVASRLRLGRLE